MSNDPQADFYESLLKQSVGTRIVAAGLSKDKGRVLMQLSDGTRLMFYAQCGDMAFPVEIMADKKGRG